MRALLLDICWAALFVWQHLLFGHTKTVMKLLVFFSGFYHFPSTVTRGRVCCYLLLIRHLV